VNLFEIQSDYNDPEVREPGELTEEEQEARQTGQTVEEVMTAKATPEAKKAAKKAATKSKKTAKPARAKKAEAQKTAPKAKKSAKPAKAKAATAAGKKKSSYVRKGEKDGSKSNRGPKGSKNPKRSAKDGGVFGRKVARARKEKGWSQVQLAEKAEITQPAVCNIEKGTAGASSDLAKKLARVLGIK
jgi:ribosome-binding protein aMBF1 (putative translation factor)